MKSQQAGSEVSPPKEDDILALIIICPKCQAQRAFKVNDGFMMVVTRASSGAEYSTTCDLCGYRIIVQLAWTRRHLGWTTEKLVLTKAVGVEDEFGLRKQHGGKSI
jgi:hypothetical protein